LFICNKEISVDKKVLPYDLIGFQMSPLISMSHIFLMLTFTISYWEAACFIEVKNKKKDVRF
jgi:hypothetical protein